MRFTAFGAVAGKFLITENRKAFFQTELKPVPAGDAIARPVMEIFMTDNAFNML